MAEGTREDVELYVKANAGTGQGIGDDPNCHRIMMILKLKHITGSVVTVHFSPIPKAFKDFCVEAGCPQKVPILKHGEYVVYNPNDIAYYIDKEWPEPDIKSTNEQANKVGGSLFPKLSGYFRNTDPSLDEKKKSSLLDELKNINNFLGSASSPGKFLDGDELKHPDCDILPKLLIVQVAGKLCKNFEIPDYLTDLHAYMAAAADHPAFASTRPKDEAIIEGWRKK